MTNRGEPSPSYLKDKEYSINVRISEDMSTYIDRYAIAYTKGRRSEAVRRMLQSYIDRNGGNID